MYLLYSFFHSSIDFILFLFKLGQKQDRLSDEVCRELPVLGTIHVDFWSIAAVIGYPDLARCLSSPLLEIY